MKTEKEKMLSGEVYYACDPLLIKELNACKDLLQQYNNLRPTDLDARREMLQHILGACDEHVFINQPFYCDYGKHIRVGKRFFANFHFTVLDEAPALATTPSSVRMSPSTPPATALTPPSATPAWSGQSLSALATTAGLAAP